jgi:eukaryotic-like serine/threonine-protein kinase
MSDPPPPTDPSDSPPDLTGRRLGDFQVMRKIGQGGMGQVYLARQLSLKREVALKILRFDHAENPTALKRFQAEAEAVARISHPNIVQVYAVGEQDGLRYMALEYVNGRNLREFLDRKGPPDLPVALAILKQVAAALQRAAEVGLVHRDIKPENVLLTRKVEVKVTDFGLSRYFAGGGEPLSLTQSGMTLGTPLYMSPEQVQGKPVDHRSDLYSLGVTAYHLLAGFPPFRGQTAFEVAAQHVQAEPESLQAVRPDLPAELCGLVHKLMAKNPDERYATAKDVSRDLGRIQKIGTAAVATAPLSLNISLSGASVSGVSVSGPSMAMPAPPTPPGRLPWRIVATALALAAAVGGWWVHDRFAPSPSSPPSTVGLPEVQLPAPLPSSRELALRDQLRTTSPHDKKHQEAGMALGLLLVSERRLDDADKVFKELDVAPLKPNQHPLPVSAVVLARLGSAIVLSHQDKPTDSNKAFGHALGLIGNRQQMQPAVEKLCFNYPEFGHAVADAVNRNADNLPKGSTLPPPVEWLRNPSTLLRGPK